MQQATINLPSAHPVRAMSGLAKCLALPAEFAPTRLPSYPALERTAVIGFNQPVRQDLGATDDYKIMLARQAAYPAWASSLGNNFEISSLEYRCDPNNVGTSYNADYTFSPGSFVVRNGPEAGSSTVLAQTGSAADVYPVGFDGSLGGLPFTWTPLAYDHVFVVHFGMPLGVDVTVSLELEYWKSPGEVTVETIAISGVAGNYAAYRTYTALLQDDTAQWIRPSKLSLLQGGVGTLVIQPQFVKVYIVNCTANASVGNLSTVPVVVAGNAANSSRAFRPIVGPAEFSSSVIPYESTRVTACSLLMTNTTQVLSKNGAMIAGRVNPRTIDPFRATETNLMSLHPAEKAWLPMETGYYTYCPPSTDLMFFWDYVRADAENARVPVYRLDNDSLVNLAVGQSTNAVSNFAVTVTTHLEFRTTSALFQLALSGYTLESLHVAQLALATAGFFFENPEHTSVLSKVIAGIRKLEPFVTPLMPQVKALPRIGRAAAAAYNVARAVVRASDQGPRKLAVKAGPQRVATTSLRGSGVTMGRSSSRRKRQNRRRRNRRK